MAFNFREACANITNLRTFIPHENMLLYSNVLGVILSSELCLLSGTQGICCRTFNIVTGYTSAFNKMDCLLYKSGIYMCCQCNKVDRNEYSVLSYSTMLPVLQTFDENFLSQF